MYRGCFALISVSCHTISLTNSGEEEWPNKEEKEKRTTKQKKEASKVYICQLLMCYLMQVVPHTIQSQKASPLQRPSPPPPPPPSQAAVDTSVIGIYTHTQEIGLHLFSWIDTIRRYYSSFIESSPESTWTQVAK